MGNLINMGLLKTGLGIRWAGTTGAVSAGEIKGSDPFALFLQAAVVWT
jgi:hypothetical protein